MDSHELLIQEKFFHIINMREYFIKLKTIKIKRIGNNLVDRIEMQNKLKLGYGDEYNKEVIEQYKNKVKENTRLKNKVRYFMKKEYEKLLVISNKYYHEMLVLCNCDENEFHDSGDEDDLMWLRR